MPAWVQCWRSSAPWRPSRLWPPSRLADLSRRPTFIADQHVCSAQQLHKPLSRRGGGRGGAPRAAGSPARPVRRGLRPPQARVEDSGPEQQVRLVLLNLRVSWRRRWRGGRRGWRGQRVSRGPSVALQPQKLLFRPRLLGGGLLRWRRGEGRRGGEKGWQRVLDVMCCSILHPSISCWCGIRTVQLSLFTSLLLLCFFFCLHLHHLLSTYCLRLQASQAPRPFTRPLTYPNYIHMHMCYTFLYISTRM